MLTLTVRILRFRDYSVCRINDKTSVHVPILVCHNSYVPNAKVYMISIRTAFSVASTRTRSGKALWETYIELSVRIAILGRKGNRDRSQCEGL